MIRDKIIIVEDDPGISKYLQAALRSHEYDTLLGRHAGQVLTYKSMMKELWGPGVGGDNKLLRVHMANIRRKIEPNPVEPQYIFTEVGVGYRMADSH